MVSPNNYNIIKKYEHLINNNNSIMGNTYHSKASSKQEIILELPEILNNESNKVKETKQ